MTNNSNEEFFEYTQTKKYPVTEIDEWLMYVMLL